MPMTRDHPQLAGRKSVGLTAEALESYDVVVITTEHTAVDYALVGAKSRLVLDTRNVFDGDRKALMETRYVKI